MIRSMTSFGRATLSCETVELTVEMRSVNNRYFDLNTKLPRAFSGLEERLKPYLQSRGISRGKVELTITATNRAPATSAALINEQNLRAYLDALYHLRDSYGLRDDISVMQVAANPAIFAPEQQQPDFDALWEQLLPVLCEATDRFLDSRDTEGARLAADLQGKLNHLKELTDRIESLSVSNIQHYQTKLEERLRALLADNNITLEENRILTECAIYADKIAIDEELVRLRSHFALFEEILAGTEPAGRKLDFLLQEMNREINTTGSKSFDATVAHLVVEAKNELEKIREQIQNLE